MMADVIEYDRDNNHLHYEKYVFTTRPRGYKAFFMLNSGEHEIYHAHKCYDANNC